MHVRVKICGLRSPETAATIVAMGAEAIGLAFAESPRRVDMDQARKICDVLPPNIVAMGVFVDADAETINETARATGITHAQLHGCEGPEIVSQISIPCVKAFRVRDTSFAEEVNRWLAGVAEPDRANLPAILLDAYSPNAAGGTGETFNWSLLADARIAGELDDAPPILLAGGLNSENVSQAIRIAKPWGVDVSSGVESAPGEKDLDKIKTFLQTVSNCSSQFPRA